MQFIATRSIPPFRSQITLITQDLIRYVELVRPRRVFTLHGFAAEFARDLRERGVEAWALSEGNQMEFSGLVKAPVSDAGECVPPSRTSFARDAGEALSEFAKLATVGEQVAATPAKLEKIRLLADYWRTLDKIEPRAAAQLFYGPCICPERSPHIRHVGGSIIYRAMMTASKFSDAEFHRVAHRHGDAGKTAFEALHGRTKPQPFTLKQSRDFFNALHKTRGPVAKTELLRSRLATLSAREGQYVVKILSGDLRIGLREGLVEEAIARAFGAPLDDVKEANMLLGDPGGTATLASRKELHRAELSIFRPIKCMLATPEPTAEAVWQRFVDERFIVATPTELQLRFTWKVNSTGFGHSFIAMEIGWKFFRAICGVSPINFQSWQSEQRSSSQS